MRILHLVNNVNETGNGITNVAVDLATEQSKLGHDVHIASGGGEYEHILSSYGVDTQRINFKNRTPSALYEARRALKRIVLSSDADVVHAHTITPTILARSIVSRPPIVATVHNEYQRGVILMALADAVVGVSQAVTDAMLARRVDPKRTCTILNGTVGSPRRIPLASVPRIDLMRPAVVTIGAISYRKGSDILLEAFGLVLEDVPEAHLYFVGNRDWPELEQTVVQRSWKDRVHFVGFNPQPQTYLREANVFVLASRREPLGLVLLEALEVGCPIVASRVDGIPEALAHGAAGVLTAAGDPVALASGIVRVLIDPMLSEALAASGLRHSSMFRVERMAREYLDLYQSLRA
jgi:glycosyltransferase involved in cell wall biosynthesis